MTPIARAASYRDTLKSKLAERLSQRSGYSLRAFARDLGYGPSQLSRVLNGKQHLSASTARIVADRLFDSPIERELFIAKVDSEGSSRSSVRESARMKVEALRSMTGNDPAHELEEDAFRYMSEWYHAPLLDLMTLKNPPKTPAGIAKLLGISATEAKLALERLIRLDLLKQEKSGRYAKTFMKLSLPSRGPSAEIRKFHRGMILKAIESIDGQTVEQRYLLGRTIALSPQHLKKVRALIDDFSNRLSEIPSLPGAKTKLYQINIQMFDLIQERGQS